MMKLLKSWYPTENTSIAIGSHDAEADISTMIEHVHDAELNFIKRLSERRAKEVLLNRWLLHHLKGKPQEVLYQQNGKPQLSGAEHHVSFSHSGNFGAVLISDKEYTGIDIERYSIKVAKIASRVFSVKEIKLSERFRSPYKALHLLWSAKEAMFKAIPFEGISFKEQLHIEIIEETENNKGIIIAHYAGKQHIDFQLGFELMQDFSLVYTF